MVVGPEYGAIIAAALGISKGQRDAIRDGLLALVVGFSAAIVLTFAFGVAVRAAGEAPAPFLHGVRPVSDLINSPNWFSVVVAILAGIVGVVSLTEARAGALIGVFISVTTFPRPPTSACPSPSQLERSRRLGAATAAERGPADRRRRGRPQRSAGPVGAAVSPGAG